MYETNYHRASSVENALDLFKKGRTRSILPAARLCSR
jgi:CO/xanthine dehydrogenase FAD-binding subunit